MSAEAIRQKLLGKFREVARDRADKLAAALLQVEGGVTAELVDELKRELHTLKGEARMMGFTGISSLVHAAEDLVAAGLERERLSGLRRACESIPLLLEEPPEGGPSGHSLLEELKRLAVGAVHAVVDHAHAVPNTVVQAAPPEVAATAPEAPRAEAVRTSAKPVETQQPAAKPAEKKPAPSRRREAGASIRIDLEVLDEIAGLTGDVLVEGAKANARVGELKEVLAGWNRLADRMLSWADDVEKAGVPDVAATIENEVHQLRTAAFRFFHYHAESVGGVQRLFSILAERVADARLIPLAELFADLPATAAALAREQGKEVDVVITGGEIGIDKAILPSLQDPLVHLLRNAIDHGLGTPEERAALGKSPRGLLKVTAEPSGDRLQVIIEDDGKGIDPEAVRRAGVRKGVITEAEAASLGERGAYDLIFAAGFSTRSAAGETSGRGVGLDVVRRRVVSLGGTVAVDSTPGVGTRFILRLPQSLSLMKVLLFRIDEDVYGIPASEVEGVGRLEPTEVEEIAGIRAVRHRGKLLPVVAAGPLLGLNGGPRSTRPTVAYVRHGEDGLALVVDGFRGEREVAVKPPSAFLKGQRYVSGAAALEDGRVALLLSPAELLAAARNKAQLPSQRSRARKRVLLVDDSLIAREAEAALLRGLGHEVDEASDGEEGWRKLRAGRYDLLVSDVQMPILDGIDLTRRVKGSPETRRTPVLILSSLETPTDKRRGVEAGADGYLGKAELDAEKLSRMVERLCGTGA